MSDGIMIQVVLTPKANAIASYEKALHKHPTKAAAINALLEQLEERMK